MTWLWVWHELWLHSHRMEFLDSRPGHQMDMTLTCSCGHVTHDQQEALRMDSHVPLIIPLTLAASIVAWWLW